MSTLTHLKLLILFSLCALPLYSVSSYAQESTEIHDDPHYSDVGFFDIHVCNWPKRTHFFKVLFSSAEYDNIESMTVYTPAEQSLITLDKNKYRTLKRNNKPDKRVYMLDIDVPEHASTGWYRIDVKTMDGKSFQAKDYVIMSKLERATGMTPDNDDMVSQLPLTLRWHAIPGANFYQVFVRDEWTGKQVYSSKLLNTNEAVIPEEKLEAGGYYSWSIHARDTNEHVLLGDFQMGSLSEKAFFTVKD